MSKNAVINIKFAADLNEFSKQIDVAYAKMRKMSDGLQRVGETMTFALTLPIALMGAAAVKSYAEIEKLQLGLQNVMGDAGAAATEYQKLLKTAQMPGIGLKEAVEGSIRLQTIGFTADRARTALEGLANAVASVGKGKFELDRAVYGLEQLANTEHPLQQDINILRNAIPQTVPILKKAFADIKNVNAETLSAAGITSKQVVDALIEGYAKLPKFAGGIQNAFDNIADSYLKASGAIGEAINKNLSIQKAFESLGAAIEGVAYWFRDLDPAFQELILLATGFLAVAGPLTFVIGSMAKALAFLQVSALGLTATFAAAFAISYALYKLFKDFGGKEVTSTFDAVGMASQKASEKLSEEKIELDKLFDALKRTTNGSLERQRLIDQINSKYGTTLKNIKDEAEFLKQVASEYNNVADAIYNKAYAQATQEEYQASIKRLMDYKRQLAKLQSEVPKTPDNMRLVDGKMQFFPKEGSKQWAEILYLNERITNELSQQQALTNEIKATKPSEQKSGAAKKTEAELKAEQDAIKKHQELLFKAEQEFGTKRFDEHLKLARKRIDKEWEGLTEAEKKKLNYQEYVEEQLYKVKSDWIDKNAELEKNKEKERAEGKKQVTDDLVKQEYDKAAKLELEAKNAYDGSIAGEYAYNDKLYNIQLQALENEIKIREKADEKVDELNIKKRDMIINHNLEMNQRQADIQEKYNSLFAKLQDLEAQRYTTKNAQKIAEIKRQLADLQAYAKSVNIEIDPAPMVDSLTEMQVRTQETFAQMNNIIESFIIDTIGGMFDAIAENVAQNLDPFQDIGFVLLKSLGNLFSQLGGLFIAFGINLELFKSGVESLNGYVAIAAGVALLAAGAAINAVAKQGLQSQSSSTAGYNAQAKSTGGDVVLVTRVDGRDLELVGGRTTYVRRR